MKIGRPSKAAAVAWLLLVALALGACTMKQDSDKPSPTQACRKEGDNCEIAKGKLGTCIQRVDCTTPDGCFVCQSQH